MNWYKMLRTYFPVEEMKSKEHIETLLKDKQHCYFLDYSADHVILFAEFEDFIFVDYVYVSSQSRGKGIGRKIINKLKQKKKTIILEVEPIIESNPDTKKRVQFYKRENFKLSQNIHYNKNSLLTGEKVQLNIMYWPPQQESELSVFSKVIRMYEEIHTYKDKEIYGHEHAKAHQVLQYHEEKSGVVSKAM